MARVNVSPPGGPEPTKGFFGVWCERAIGRINICGVENNPELVDDIQMWGEQLTSVGPATWGSIKHRYR
jgi:hypothetical protein